MQKTVKKHMFDAIFVLLLLVLFAFVSFLLVSIGAGVYSNIVSTTEDIYQSRTSLAYVTNKVRYVNFSNLSLENIEDQDVLVIQQQEGDETYKTLIYFYDHSLMEMSYKADSENPALEYGTVIVDELTDFTFTKQGPLLYLSCTTADGNVQTLALQMAPTEVGDLP